MEHKFLKIWLGIAVTAITAFLVYRHIEKKKYFTYINGLGFGDYWLDQLSFQQLKDLYTYIHDYTQIGKQVTAGSSLDFRLIDLSKKFPVLLKYS